MFSTNQFAGNQIQARNEQVGPPAKKRRLIDTIISASEGTIENHELCDHLISTYSETNRKLRSRLEDVQVKLVNAERSNDDLEAEHNQCSYWIQKNEKLVEILQDHAEGLEQEKKRLQERCDLLEKELPLTRGDHSIAR